MRILVMFDLPVVNAADRRDYQIFRKYLIKNGFLMMQESIYCKIVPNTVVAENVIDQLHKNKPKKGIAQVLKITEKQFSKIEYLVGSSTSEVYDGDERLVIL